MNEVIPVTILDEGVWDIPLEQLTKEQRSLMFKTDRKRAFQKITVARLKEYKANGGKCRKKQQEQRASDNINNALGGLDGIDKVTRRILAQIDEKIGKADVLDLAKTLDILSDVKAKALKDSLSVQAANYTPTVITQEHEDKPIVDKDSADAVVEQIDRPLVEVDIEDRVV